MAHTAPAAHPAAEPLPDFNAQPDLIRAIARERPHATALIDATDTLDYAALDAAMDRVAATLQRDGAKPGDTIAICAYACNAYVVLFMGALRAGLAVAPLAPSSTREQIAGMTADAGARHLFLDAPNAQAVPATLTGTAQRIRLDDSADGDAQLADWLLPAGAKPQPVAIERDWAFNIIYSSGTTGTPKGIVQSHGMRWSQVRRAEAGGYGADTVTLIATPLYSNTTLVVVIPTLARGGALVLMPKFDCAAYLALAEAHRATHTMLVPVQYQRLMAWPDFDRHDLSSFRFKACTSAPFRPEVKAEVLRRWPGALTEYYGMTEGGGSTILYCHLYPTKLHTVGQPAEGHEIRLIDEDGRELPRGTDAVGEVVGRSAAMMLGYHNQSAKSREAEWHDSQGRRFIRTGDVGRFDEDGFLILMDRRKDMVISGGFNIYPSDLEAELRQHPAVADVAVVGVPSEAWGETPVAFVVRRVGRDESADAIRQWMNERVGKTQRLADLRFIDELPRSAIGKVLKRELREGYRSECRTEEPSIRCATQAIAIDPDRPWVGSKYQKRHSVFVLGESYAGVYRGESEYDDVYWQECLDGQRADPLFDALQEKLGIPAAQWWPTIAFTNLSIGSIGPTTQTVVATSQLRAGLRRLGQLIDRLQPRGVLVLGAATRDVAGPFLEGRGVPWRWVYHPSGKNNWIGRYACTPEQLQTAWRDLTSRL